VTAQTDTVNGVPILWEEPAGATKGVVLWLPGFTENKESTSDYLRQLAASGFLALSLDPVDHGERSRRADGQELAPESGSFRSPTTGHLYRHYWSIEAETAQEIPAVLDWAMAKYGPLPAVGVGGKSMGGDISVVAAGIDRRIVVVAACIATPDWLKPGSMYELSAPNAEIKAQYERYNPLTNLDRYQHHPALSFHCRASDPMVPPDGAVRFVQALNPLYRDCPERLQVVLYGGTEHELTDQMWRNAKSWFERFMEHGPDA
jgi:dienelactone hydrolase